MNIGTYFEVSTEFTWPLPLMVKEVTCSWTAIMYPRMSNSDCLASLFIPLLSPLYLKYVVEAGYILGRRNGVYF